MRARNNRMRVEAESIMKQLGKKRIVPSTHQCDLTRHCRKGKLRKADPVNLGKQYAGAQVSRDALDAESEDDPFAAHSDEDDEDDESSEEDAEAHGEADEASSDEDLEAGEFSGEEGSDAEDSDAISGEDSQEDSEDEDSDDDDDATKAAPKSSAGRKAPVADDREELRRLMASDQKTIAATISQAAKADAAKGKAVKEQRTTFDALLNTRIKLQKGMGAINELGDAEDVNAEGEENSDEGSNVEAIKSAESAALALWSTLEELRNALANAQAKDESKKRKRPSPVDSTIKTSQLWDRMSDLESDALISRRATLDKWSSKVRGTPTSLPNARGKLLGSGAAQQTITAVLDANVATELGDRSSKRARSNNTSNGTQAEPVYDDTVFYQSLLRDLVEQRMSSSDAMTGGLDTLQQLPSRLPIHHVTGMRNDKNRRENVDTRASKGRKMRFNVHERLQNFMAPEDRGAWSGRARDEFFASLLGKTASGLLGEDDSGSDEESDIDREEGGLMLFRN